MCVFKPNVVVALHPRRRQRSSTYLPQNPNIQKSNVTKKSAYSESKVETSHLALNGMNEYSKSNVWFFKDCSHDHKSFSKCGYPMQPIINPY